MFKIKSIPVSTFDGYMKAVARVKRSLLPHNHSPRKIDRPQVWFRGQQCAAWGLSPKLYRPEYADAQEAELRFQFQSRALQLLTTRPPEDEWSWYFLMQHYGCPTRLLDWTDSPLLGLFFALHGAATQCSIHRGSQCDRVVWVLNPWRLNERAFKGVVGPILSDWGEAGDYLIKLREAFDREEATDFRNRRVRPAALDPPHLDRRIAVQGSHFVIFAKERDLSRTGPKSLQKIVIPHARTVSIADEVDALGINVANVFPDLDHLGELLRELARKPART